MHESHVRHVVNVRQQCIYPVLYSAPRCPVRLWSDSASLVEVHRSPVEMTGVRSLSGQSLLKSENDRNSLSGWTPVDFDQTMTGL
jgi:hypothetical protein